MSERIIYQHLKPGAIPPTVLEPIPFRAVVIIESLVTCEWRINTSQWLVQSGCLYMMAWGNECSLWDDSVDMANIENFEFKEIPENSLVMTTWHTNETLAEVFWFAKHNAFHSTVKLNYTLLLHISAQNRKHDLLMSYIEA